MILWKQNKVSSNQKLSMQNQINGSSTGKDPPAMQETSVPFLGWEVLLEKD